MNTRNRLVAANWKMQLSAKESESLAMHIVGELAQMPSNCEVVFAASFPVLDRIVSVVAGQPNVSVAAQNCAIASQGALTGEVSPEMLKEIGVSKVIIGHSERRLLFSEDNATLKRKVDAALAVGLDVIFCCGETDKERQAGMQMQVVEKQFKESLGHLKGVAWDSVSIAYEPVWAIGTGKTPTGPEIEEMIGCVRVLVHDHAGNTGVKVRVIYGGSVNTSNAKDIFALAEVDGGLVGGASQNALDFVQIINSLP